MVFLAVPILLALAAGMVAIVVVGERRTTTLLVLGAAGLGAFVLAMAVLGFGLGPGDRRDQSASATTDQSTTATDEDDQGSGPVLMEADAQLRAFDDEEFPPRAATVDSVEDGQVVIVWATGFDAAENGSVHQCPTGSTSATRCRSGLPVTFDEFGDARVGVEVQRRFRASDGRMVDCGERVRRCAVVVFGTDRGQALLAFGGPAAPDPLIRLTPRRVSPGGAVEVSVTGAVPGEAVVLAECSSGDAGFACRPLTGPSRVDRAGSLTARVVIGADRCRRGRPCALAAISEDGTTQLGLARLAITGRPGADYDRTRLLSGMFLTAALLLIAVVLIRRTDWMAVEGNPFAGIDAQRPT